MGYSKTSAGMNTFWDLLVWLLKGHLALKTKVSWGYTQNSETSVCVS